ncbi:transposable element Tc1 transposase [Trichonephila clavipes]|nr:transposable element Tc1 transposase [Trichonephila clavipes]
MSNTGYPSGLPLRRNRRQYEQLTDFDRGRIIGLREAGWSNRRIGRHLGRSDMVVARVGNSGSQKTSSAIKRNHKETTDRSWLEEPTSAKTLPLTPHHRQCRLDFCRPRATWSVTDWRRVIFSDESRFSLSDDDHRTRVEAHRPAVRSGIYCRAAYSNFTKIVLPMLSSRPGAIYQQDNARPHTARLSQQCLQGYDVLPWPAKSPDLSPIEHVWTRWEGNCSRPEIQEN